MTILYRIKPADKKSVEAFYDVYSKDEQGNIRGWNVTELYRWGQGFVENEDELPFKNDRYHCIDPTIGWGSELEDLCAVDFEFDESFTEEEKEEIEQQWEDGGAGWLYDGDHNWEVEEDTITILGPFTVDKIDEDVYNIETNDTIELKPRPPFVATTAWPFSG
jgi:hypothetical protein